MRISRLPVSSVTRVLWVTATLDSGPLADGTSHDSASVRYRLLLPAHAMARMGIASDIANPEATINPADIEFAAYQAIVIGKYSHYDPGQARAAGASIIALAARAKARGVRIIADVCDDRFDHPLLGAYWRELVGMVDHVVAGSDEMADVARRRTRSRVTTIADPVEGARGTPFFAPPRRRWLERFRTVRARPLRLLWYGHQSNLDEVTEFLPRLAAWANSQKSVDSIAFAVMCAPGHGAEEFVAHYGAGPRGTPQIAFLPWSTAAQAQALRECDMVVIPATLDRAEKRAKSANRLTEAVWAGRLVLAHPVPSYLEFRDCASIGEDLTGNLSAVLKRPAWVLPALKAGQEIIGRRYSPEAIGQLWAAVARGA